VSDYVHNNWVENVVVRTSWDTDIRYAAKTLAEFRTCLRLKPQREVEAQLTPLTQQQVSRVLAILTQFTDGDFYFPIYCDVSRLTSDVAAASSTLALDTTYRRFRRGEYLLILPWDGGSWGDPIAAQISTAGSAVQASSIALASAIGTDTPSGSLVFPMISSIQGQRAQLSQSSPRSGDAKIVATERVTSLDNRSDSAPSSSYGSYYVFPALPDLGASVEVKASRRGTFVGVGMDVVVTSPSSGRVLWSYEATSSFFSRESYWPVKEFFDWARGRWKSFWVPAPIDSWELHAFASTYFEIKQSFALADFEDNVEHVSIVLKDGTIYIRTVTSWTDTGTEIRVAWSSAIAGVDLADVAYVGIAFLGRFSRDRITETWLTNEVVSVSLAFEEVLDGAEAADTISNIDYDPSVSNESC